MRTRVLPLTIILVFVAALLHVSLWSERSDPKLDWFVAPSGANSESLMARGDRYPLACSDVFDLELIPGVGEKLADGILGKRESILRPPTNGSTLPNLLGVHGVGKKKRLLLSKYLSFEQNCPSMTPQLEASKTAGSVRDAGSYNVSE